jgi:hypothetical protein
MIKIEGRIRTDIPTYSTDRNFGAFRCRNKFAVKKETSRSTVITFWRHVTQRREEGVRADIQLTEEVLKKRQKYIETFGHKIYRRKGFIHFIVVALK